MRPAAKTILLSREALFPSLFIQVKLGITFIFLRKTRGYANLSACVKTIVRLLKQTAK